MLGTGWFAAVAAEAGPGKTVAVVGDGAVGLMAVLAANQLGAEQIIAMSRHPKRQKLARFYGATDIETWGDQRGFGSTLLLTAQGHELAIQPCWRCSPDVPRSAVSPPSVSA